MNIYDAIIYHVEQTLDRKLEEEEMDIFFEVFNKGVEAGAKAVYEDTSIQLAEIIEQMKKDNPELENIET